MTYCKPQVALNNVKNNEINKVAEITNISVEKEEEEGEILLTAHRTFRPLFIYRKRQIHRNGNRNGNRNRNRR